MKKYLAILIALVMLLGFTSCNSQNNNSNNKEKQTYIMTVDDHNAVLEDYNEYMYALFDFSYEVIDIINEHPELYAAKTITLSDYSSFNVAKEHLFNLSDEIKNYNTDYLIPEWKTMFSKLYKLSEHNIQCAKDISGEMDTLALFSYMETFGEKQVAIVEEISEQLLDATEKIDEMSNNASTKEPTVAKTFTNKYGTATTRCFHSGCNNYIASTGDTNCCTTHSARCLNCNCYIDEDAMYCMSCLSSSSNSSNSYSSNSSYSSDTCKYTYSSGSVCGAKTNKYTDLCNTHFNELNNIYQSFVN